MSIFVAIPTAESIHALTTAAAFRICAGYRGGAEFRTIVARPTDHARNLCVQAFLRTNHSHMLFLDSDVVPPDNCIDLLMGANRPLACGVYPLLLGDSTLTTSLFRKAANGEYHYVEDLSEQPFEVDAAGMGCCLIARAVLERVAYPWFRFEFGENCKITGEDFYFFEQAAATGGYKPLVIPQAICGHYKNIDLLDVFKALRRSR